MAKQEPEKKRSVTIALTETECKLLSCLDEEGSVENVLLTLADHAQQGVYRPGAWERMWIEQAFGDDFEDLLEPGCPYGRPGGEALFQRPRANGRPPAPQLHKLNETEGA